MSDAEGPGQGPNRTVFRPSPLQNSNRAPDPAAPPAAPAPMAPAGFPAPAPPPAPMAAARPGAKLGQDDVPPAGQPPVAARNPMMTAAGPLLALLSSIRAGRVRLSLPDLHGRVVAAIDGFEQGLRGKASEDHVQRGKYALCSVADDVALNLPGHENDGAEWARRSMMVRYFGENVGGDRFWRLLEEMIARPAEFSAVLELYHACMAAGFEGRYRVMADGRHAHQQMMQRVFLALPHPPQAARSELAPHWRGEPTPLAKVSFWAPMALAAAIAATLLVVIYIVLRVILAQTGGPTLAALKAINPDQPLRLSRTAPAPPAPPAGLQAQRLRTFLAPEISQGLVTVVEDASTARVRTTVGQLFRSGSDQLESGQRPLMDRIAQAVDGEPGPVRIEGYTDSDRVSTIAFPDNIALSQARADAVAAIVRGRLSDPSRVTAIGYGDDQAIAPNTSAAGKASNRRVEIVVQRGG